MYLLLASNSKIEISDPVTLHCSKSLPVKAAAEKSTEAPEVIICDPWELNIELLVNRGWIVNEGLLNDVD